MSRLPVVVNSRIKLTPGFDIADFALRALKVKGVDQGFVSLNLVGRRRMVTLNSRYLNRTYLTDIITFNLEEPGEVMMGDVYICPDKARRNAGRFHHSLDDELKLLVVHGILHLLHYEDYTDAQQRDMFQEQERILARIASPQ